MAEVKQTNKVLHFGDLVTAVGTTQLYPLGCKREQDGKTYRYVKQNDATVTVVAGNVALAVDPTATDGQWIVCCDVSDSDGAFAVGIYMGVIANAGFGWVQSKGYHSAVKKPATAWVKGDVLFAGFSSTSDGKAFKLTDEITGTVASTVTRAKLQRVLERPIGFAAAAISSTTALGGVMIDLE